MILLLGSSGYIGQAFKTVLDERGEPYATLPRSEASQASFSSLTTWLSTHQPSFVINAAGYTGKPNVDACEISKAETLKGNLLWPSVLAQACSLLQIPYGHVSSGCIFNGAQVKHATCWKTETDLSTSAMAALLRNSPERIRGFSETDIPNFTFRQPSCSFYSGTKALAEEALMNLGQGYLWRLRLPFDHWDHPKNYLSKLLRYERAYYNVNSLSHRLDFAKACLDCWHKKIPFGIYHMTNPGFVSTSEVIDRIKETLRPKKKFIFWESDAEFYAHAASAPRSNCILETGKLSAAGIHMRPITEALEESLTKWTPHD